MRGINNIIAHEDTKTRARINAKLLGRARSWTVAILNGMIPIFPVMTTDFNCDADCDPTSTRKLHACPIIGRVFQHLWRLTRAVIRRHVALLGAFSNIYANPEISDILCRCLNF